MSAAEDEVERHICEVSEVALARFAACQLPPLKGVVHIEVKETVPNDCFGAYHCGDNSIEILSPDRIGAARRADSPFAVLSDAAFFDSIVVHELAHAAYSTAVCPVENCVAGSEYVAFAMQLMSLAPKELTSVTSGFAPRQAVTDEELSPFIYFFAPDLFAAKAWKHLQQQDDPCTFIGRLVRGEVTLDNDANL